VVLIKWYFWMLGGAACATQSARALITPWGMLRKQQQFFIFYYFLVLLKDSISLQPTT
jgi:hypothetical protein